MNRIRLALSLLATLFMLTTSARAGSGDALQRLSRPVTLANVPEVPECREVALTQAVLDIAQTSLEDPAEAFEKWRIEHRSMMEQSPGIECESKLWQELRRSQGLGNVASVPPGTAAFNLKPAVSPEEAFLRSLLPLRPDAASVGGNVLMAGGVENYQGEMQIAVNPTNHLQLVAGANHFYADPNCPRPGGGATNGTQALYGSTDGGVTWNYKCAPWPSDISGSVSGAVFFFGSDPALAWDDSGHAYVAYMLLNCNSAQTSCGYSIVVARSGNAGQTWTPWGTVVNHSADAAHGDDKEMIAVDNSPGPASTKSHPGRVYLIWDDLNIERVAYSDDGASWTTVVLPVSSNAIGGNLVVGPDGIVYAIWNRLNDPELIVFSRSVDGGNTWTTPVTAASAALLSFGTNNSPPAQESRSINSFGSIAMDSNSSSAYFGRLYIVYNDFPTGTSAGTDINVYLVSSSDGGVSWSPRVKVNDDAGTATQFFPWVAVDQSDGSVNVSWYDSRIDAANRKTQVFYARSSNGGVSFEPNILVNDSGGVVWRNAINYSDENTTDNASRNGNQYGDYAGIAAYNRQVHPFWMDTRNFFPSADTVAPTRREDAASATIVNCSPPSAIAAPIVTANCAVPRVTVSWSAPASAGTNATSMTYSVYRATTPFFPAGSPLVSGLSGTTYDDSTGLPTVTYYYFVRAKNNCPGTTLTPMSTTSAVSAAIVFPACGSTVGNLQGRVTASGSPLAAVAINAAPYSTTTDANGNYAIGPIPTGTYTVTATLSGYDVATANNVAVLDGQTTTQNFALVAASAGSCFTDTTRAQFEAGALTNLDSTGSPDDLKLALTVPEAIDQHADDNGFGSGYGFSSTAFAGQTFTPAVTAMLTKVETSMFCASCSGANPNLTLEVRTTSAGLPVMTAGGLLATASLAGFSGGTSATKTFVFATPPTLIASTQYGFVVKLVSNRTTGTQAWISTSGDIMAGGRRVTCTAASCANPTGTNSNSDLVFAAYMKSAIFQTSGTLISTVKDTNPALGAAPNWNTLSWTATTPANTSVKFQVAGSSNVAGPFNFVGPDGTASTFFTTSGASLSQFNGKRYLRYKAILSTTDTAATPTLSDVTVCDAFGDCSGSIPTIVPGAAQTCSSSTGNTASGPAGMTSYAWTISNGSITGGASTQTVTYTAGASGSVQLGLTVTTSAGCTAANSASISLTTTPTPTITPGGPTTFCTGGSVTLTSSSATSNQWYLGGNPIGGATNQQYIATASGNYTVVVTSSGCASAPSSATAVTVNPIPSTPTITPGGPTTFCSGGSVTLTSSSASGNQWYLSGNPIGGATGQQYVASAAGNYTVIVTTSGCASAASSATTVTITTPAAAPTITPGGPTTFCSPNNVTLTSSSASGNQWYLNGNPIGGATNQQYVASASGSYTVITSASGCASVASAATVVTVNFCFHSPSDLNANNMSDIVLQNTNTNSVAAWLMEDNTLVDGKVVSNPTAETKIVATGDLDGDLKADLIAKNNTTGAISMWKMNANVLVSQTVIATPNVAQRIVATYDFNHDGKDDIVLQNSSTGAVSLWLMNGATLTTGIALGNPGVDVKAVAVGKFGGDAILFQDNSSGAISRWTISSNAIASNLSIGTPAAGTNVVAAADFDGDGNTDIALQQTSSRTVSVWLIGANGTTIAQNAVVATPVFDWKVVGAGDYN
ncbi:MAG: hypothetical protein JWO97_4656, partial [Acidobacteria bacterium]|nr:hypothetical protein [Acidobacteriota bacterium]